MASLVHAALTLRKTARIGTGVLIALGFAAVPLLGAFHGRPLGLEHIVVFGAWTLWLAKRAMGRWKSGDPTDVARTEIELGLLLLAGTHSIVQATGGLDGPLYPMVYVLVAAMAAFLRRAAGTALVVFSIVYEALVYLLVEPTIDLHRMAFHAVFILFFAVLNVVFTQLEIARVRETHRRERDEEKQRVDEEARLFRLVGTASANVAEGGEDKLLRSSLGEVRDALFHVLDLLKRSLDLHTCAVLFAGDDGRLRIVEMVTESDEIAEGPFEAGAGAIGAVASRGLVMNLEHVRPGYKGLCYYRGVAPVRAFCAVPIVENGQLRGALCADRREDRSFTAVEEETLKTAVKQILRSMQNERVVAQLERTKREQAVLFRASSELGAALSEDDVLDAVIRAASGIVRVDFAAVTAFDADRRVHDVRRAEGEGAEAVDGMSFRDNHSLTAMVVKNRHALPYRGDFDSKNQVLYTSKITLPEFRSVLVLPLISRENVIGTLSLATLRPGAFGDSVRATLSVLANQLATSLENAKAVRRLEEMATTDGLTGCLNKRAFLEELDAKLRSAERFGKKLSLIVTDIDHFKSVNDTYGHATGDVVIKELGAILMRAKRETDRVARFGGEEFCVLCEETDTEGALQLAERVRDEIGRTLFQTELGKLKVTASLGVATYPLDAKTSSSLFEITDKALYAAKHNGRNQVCTTAHL